MWEHERERPRPPRRMMRTNATNPKICDCDSYSAPDMGPGSTREDRYRRRPKGKGQDAIGHATTGRSTFWRLLHNCPRPQYGERLNTKAEARTLGLRIRRTSRESVPPMANPREKASAGADRRSIVSSPGKTINPRPGTDRAEFTEREDQQLGSSTNDHGHWNVASPNKPAARC